MNDYKDSIDEARRVLAAAEVLHSASSVQAAYDKMARMITAEYSDLSPLVLTVMNGGLMAAAEITSRLGFPFEMGYVHATRYRGATTGGGLVWKMEPERERVQGRHILLIDDILDEGYTMVEVRRALQAMEPKSVKMAILVQKIHDRLAPGAEAEFVGLTVPDRYVFGCGMDYKEYWRQLPAIYAVRNTEA